VTVPLTCTTVSRGLKKSSPTVAPTAACGVEAVAEKVSVGRVVSAGVAVTDCGVDDPILSVALATPDALVVLCAGLTPPPPDATAQFTTTPGTGQLLASRAVTLNGDGSGLLKYQG
jgi:hypothetical protein